MKHSIDYFGLKVFNKQTSPSPFPPSPGNNIISISNEKIDELFDMSDQSQNSEDSE